MSDSFRLRAAVLTLPLAAALGLAACKPHAKAPVAATAAPAQLVQPTPPAPAKPPVDLGPPPTRGTFLSLFYSSNLFGEYEPCG